MKNETVENYNCILNHRVNELSISETHIDVKYNQGKEITKEKLKDMTKYYLENNSRLKCNDYAWLRKNAFSVIDILYKLKNRTAYNLSAEIYKKFDKIIAPKSIIKHFKNIGVIIPIGERRRAVKRCGSYYRKKLDRIEKKIY